MTHRAMDEYASHIHVTQVVAIVSKNHKAVALTSSLGIGKFLSLQDRCGKVVVYCAEVIQHNFFNIRLLAWQRPSYIGYFGKMTAYDNEGATISMEDVRDTDRPITINTIEEELIARRNRMMKTQKSTVASRKQQAVCVRRAHKRYGTAKSPNVILDGLNMTVPKGAIYGLLGASGCGKTTLLSCIVGRRRLNSGEIWVLGGKPGSPGSGVPGPRIGYMPQEVALFGEFTIRETLIYFGWIANMATKDVEERIDFLIQLLQLPNPTRQVKNLSGGQQRRTSLAAALIHDPELLILDEPTVGVDPVLRQRFLAEEAPSELIRRYNAESLEEVFLKLSVIQNLGKRRRSSILADVVEKVELPTMPDPSAIDLEEAEIGEISGEFGDNVSMSSKGRVVVTPDVPMPVESLPPEEKATRSFVETIKPMKWHHMKALIWKNFWSLFRNFGVIAFIMGLPVSQMVFFCLAIGHYPVGLPIAVVNYESNSTTPLCPYEKTCPQDLATYEWNLTDFSCVYLEFLSKRQDNLILYPTKEAAMYDASHGKARAVLVFHSNFSTCLQDRITDPRRADLYTVKNSDIEAHMDDTDKQVEWMLNRDIQLAFMEAAEYLAKLCDLPKRIMSIPVYFNKPIYGLDVPNFTDFAGPGVILTIIFFLAVALTSGSMLAERNEGILERSLVSGITGFVVSCICDTDRTATYLALGSFLPMVLLCGIIWPVEGMHIVLQWISYVLPLTKSTESLRSMLQRGWSISVPTVYSGFISTGIWIVVYLTTSILLLKFKKG
ncbi:hypothetical protein O3G_MSEX007021 [Manduca sexta]|uniref:ABC transporter domain-containing protein n=1 Tax=Manduca sexta TaxID=7130 RepID=A0A921Z645_MANSE|nr:hypothetical protein O3G_MSEX007021 [Manduca sexta]